MKTPLRFATVALLAAGAAGCSGKEDVSYKAILSNPTPEMRSAADTEADADGNYAYMRNMNYRSLWDDLGRMFYIDSPSRLSSYPIVDTSGNAR